MIYIYIYIYIYIWSGPGGHLEAPHVPGEERAAADGHPYY